MLHARKDYNRIQDPENKIPSEEPVFLLRGQDRCAPDTLCYWATLAEQQGVDPELVTLVRNHASLMLNWQMTHGSKIPDLPNPTKDLVTDSNEKILDSQGKVNAYLHLPDGET